MLRDNQKRQPVDRWMDKLAPKVAQLQDALKQIPAEEIAQRSGTLLQGDVLPVQMLFRPYQVDTQNFVVRKKEGGEVPSFLQSLILTYLHVADGTPLAGRWISFRELPNGGFYHQAFQGYAPNRLTKCWDFDIDGFMAACGALGGKRIDLGDASFVLPVLPRIEMAAVYWLGDEDFPSRASILFDAHAHHYMVTDGLAILGSQLVGKILAAGRS